MCGVYAAVERWGPGLNPSALPLLSASPKIRLFPSRQCLNPNRLAKLINARLDRVCKPRQPPVRPWVADCQFPSVTPSVARAVCFSVRPCKTLMQRLGIGHGAVRTAVSRLAADGWISARARAATVF